MGAPILVLMKSGSETMGPTDITGTPAPPLPPIPTPSPGKSLPMMFMGPSKKVMVEASPILLIGSKSPMCQPHGGPIQIAAGPGLGIGEMKAILAGVSMVKIEGKEPCAGNVTLYQHNKGNTPPSPGIKGNPKVKVT